MVSFLGGAVLHVVATDYDVCEIVEAGPRFSFFRRFDMPVAWTRYAVPPVRLQHGNLLHATLVPNGLDSHWVLPGADPERSSPDAGINFRCSYCRNLVISDGLDAYCPSHVSLVVHHWSDGRLLLGSLPCYSWLKVPDSCQQAVLLSGKDFIFTLSLAADIS